MPNFATVAYEKHGRMVAINQLAMQKMVINQATEQAGLMQTQRLATILTAFPGTRLRANLKDRSKGMGWKQAVQDRDEGTLAGPKM